MTSDKYNTEIAMNRIESIVHDKKLALRRKVRLSDFTGYFDKHNLFNDIDHCDVVCTLDELKDVLTSQGAPQ